ncbi:formate dehydrogenase [Methylibium sp. T29]|uniref:formate dehydrogenase n=1 Tax=Methylibium sp. T29 TaxID=1430884 RepID=UPI0004ACFA4C
MPAPWGALAAAAVVLPGAREAEPAAAAAVPLAEAGEAAGYRLTAHVQRYYQTTKV